MYAYNLGKELKERGLQIAFLIPNYGCVHTEEYAYDGLRVIKYAEPSVVDRALKMGKRVPDGLSNFIEVLKEEQPGIVHFHEIAGSNGITFSHVKAAKDLGFKTVTTLHVSRYTAAVDNGSVTDDIFDVKQGAKNLYRSKGFNSKLISILLPIANLCRHLHIDLSHFGKTGTALAMPQLIEKKKYDFLEFIANCDKVVTIAKWYHSLLLHHHVDKKKLEFIEQGINISDVPAKRQQNFSKKLTVIFVGRISQIKGVKNLIEALCRLDTTTIRVDIFGDSGEDPNYLEACEKLVAGKDNIQLKGRLHPEDAMSVMASYDILVLPSTVQEMSPLVIREAFAAGVPVLASDSMGAKEQIEDGKNGWLFKMNDVDDLTEKLRWLAAHPEKVKEAMRHLPASGTFSAVAEEYLALYKNILKEPLEVLNH